MRVHEVMRTVPVTVPADSTVAQARALAEAEGVRHLVVVSGRRVVGVVEEDGLWLSAEDVLRTAAGMQGSLTARDARTVRSAMHPAVPSVSSHESFETAARLMLLKRRTAVPVIDDGALVGVLTIDECRKAIGAPLMAVLGSDDPSERPDAADAGTDQPRSNANVA